MEALKIIAASWPIAAMVIALCGIAAGWSTIRRSMKFSRDAQLDRAQGNQAVVVRGREDD